MWTKERTGAREGDTHRFQAPATQATSDSVGDTSAAGTSESASQEKWKDEDLGWLPKLSVQARVA